MNGEFDRVGTIISDLRRLPDVVSVVVARRDGTVIASNMPKLSNPNKVASIAAAVMGTSEMAMGELDYSGHVEVMIKSSEGRILGVGAGEEAILVALVASGANIGLVLLSMERSANEIADMGRSIDNCRTRGAVVCRQEP